MACNLLNKIYILCNKSIEKCKYCKLCKKKNNMYIYIYINIRQNISVILYIQFVIDSWKQFVILHILNIFELCFFWMPNKLCHTLIILIKLILGHLISRMRVKTFFFNDNHPFFLVIILIGIFL
jgi:hypothetical protein